MLSRSLITLFGVVLSLLLGTQVLAREDVWKPAQDNVTWRAECSACHVAFPPGLLTPQDWLEIMAHLDQHFGVDASMDAASASEIANYLKQNASNGRQSGSHEGLARITSSDRFVAKHRSAIRLWQKRQINTLSDCGACHKEALAKPIDLAQ